MFDLTSLLTSIPELITSIDDRIRRSRGQERALLVELKMNIGIIQPFANDEANIDRVITALEITAMKDATESGFDFNSVKKGEVKAETVGDNRQLATYVGWSTERLFLNIYEKIMVLQKIIQIDTNKNVRKPVRLNNIFLLMALLVKHIES
jgi:hypothetical protein